jgi:hypothetical protein
VYSIPQHRVRDISLVLSLAAAARALALHLLPLDWNWDSYHHWQISWYSLKVGFPQWRLWDLNGCEYYWGMFPHLVEAALMGAAGSPGIQPFRFLNVVLGVANAGLVCLIGRRFASPRVGLWAGLIFAAFPVAAVFDVLALQDTMALTLLLASLYVSKTRPFWSGILLGLAAQSRTEILLASAIIVTWAFIVERYSTHSQPMVLGWLFVTIVASFYLWNQTGNPIYNLYWSLYKVFSSAPGAGGASFLDALWAWASWKLSVWPTKTTGLLILSAATALPLYFVYTIYRRPRDFQMVYFLPVAAISAPTFLPYLGADTRMRLVMLRLVTPTVALCLPMLLGFILAHFAGSFRRIAVVLLLIFTIGFYPLVSSYTVFQTEATTTMGIADKTYDLYTESEGTLVCDYPMMNYRLVYRWSLPEGSMICNHYAPQYYGTAEPLEYVKWLANHKVTVWVRYGEDAEAVYAAVNEVSPKMLVEAYEDSGIKVYLVDSDALYSVLG